MESSLFSNLDALMERMDAQDLAVSVLLDRLVICFTRHFPPYKGKALWTLARVTTHERTRRVIWRRYFRVRRTDAQMANMKAKGHVPERYIFFWSTRKGERYRLDLPKIYAKPDKVEAFKEFDRARKDLMHIKDCLATLLYRMSCYRREAKKRLDKGKPVLPLDARIDLLLADHSPTHAFGMGWIREMQQMVDERTDLLLTMEKTYPPKLNVTRDDIFEQR